jgi:hydrogenase-4 transcriptional activator
VTGATQLEMLLDVWRHVGRHLEIEEFLRAVGPNLRVDGRHVDLAILRADELRGQVRALAAVGPHLGARLNRAAIAEPTLVGLLRRVTEEGQDIASRRLGRLFVDDAMAPPTAFIRPLLVHETSTTLLMTTGPRSADRELLLGAIAEPFACAVHNDRRLHELARLREAAEAENRSLRVRLARDDISETIVGATTGLVAVLKRVDQVAPTDAPVMVFGETGSGKEVVARAIHTRSSRRDGPFLRVNCGAVPAELIDSELFGHEKGSFTGAIATRKGWFERADGGTLFLDEVGELSQAAQVRLLRVLQDGTFERVGGQAALHADVRIIAATHRDLKAMVESGAFREDLWYRISVFPIRLPALRDRAQDIPSLASHFATRAGLRLHGIALTPSRADIDRLIRYPWPGNVRELASVIERAAILGDGHHLDIERALGDGDPRTPHSPPASPLATFDDAGRAAIRDALRAANGRIEGPTGAASRLGVKPSTLRSRMKRLGISADG